MFYPFSPSAISDGEGLLTRLLEAAHFGLKQEMEEVGGSTHGPTSGREPDMSLARSPSR